MLVEDALVVAGLPVVEADLSLHLALELPLAAPSYIESGQEVSDDGGEVLEIEGKWRIGPTYAVAIGGTPCYSGRMGDGYSPVPHAGLLRLVVPAGLAVGEHDIVVSWSWGGEDYERTVGAVVVRRRHRRLMTYDLARMFVPDVHARGDTRPEEGEVLD